MPRLLPAALVGLALACLPASVHAAAPEQLSVDTGQGPVVLTRYAADVPGVRPAVLLLHGARGIELRPRAYERYAEQLAESGIDVYLVRYFTAADNEALAPASTQLSRETYETRPI